MGTQGERKERTEPVTQGLATTLTPSTNCLPYILRCSTCRRKNPQSNWIGESAFSCTCTLVKSEQY